MTVGIFEYHDGPEFWMNREDYPEEGIACLSRCGQA